MRLSLAYDICAGICISVLVVGFYHRPGRNHIRCVVAGVVVQDFWTDEDCAPFRKVEEWFVESVGRECELRKNCYLLSR